MLDALVDADTAAFIAVNGLHHPFWDHFMMMFSDKWVWIPLYIVLAYVIFRNRGWRFLVVCLLSMVVVMLITDGFTSNILRPLVGRLRPSNLDNPVSAVTHVVEGYRGGAFGFPSSHSANSWGLAFFIALVLRHKWLTAFMTLWALVTCYSRLYLGVHYPGDLLVGMLIGALSATAVYYLLRRTNLFLPIRDVRYATMPIAAGLAITLILIAISGFLFQ